MKLLPPIKETSEDYEEIEKKIRDHLKTQIYLPIVKEIGQRKILNSIERRTLLDAIRFGRVQFYRGSFSGEFSARISRDLKKLGAKWNRSDGTWRIAEKELPQEIKTAILASRSHFELQLQKIDKKLQNISPESVSKSISLEKSFDQTLWKMDRKFKQNVKNLAVLPELTNEQRKKIASEWQNNLQLFIKDFVADEIPKLRKAVRESVFAGNRYDRLAYEIKKSFDVTERKAKFLARQETGLLMAKFKEVRYKDCGIKVYKWVCVSGSPKHPVRPTHKACDGKFFTWDQRLSVNEDGSQSKKPVEKPGDNHDLNPGQDYNCRCAVRPVIRF